MKFNGREFRITTPDSILGAGINFGATFERKINDKAFLFISGGYNLSDSVTERCDADFNGFYGIVGFGVKF
jgi:hypothetical protein